MKYLNYFCYTAEERKQHQEHCGECPVYERARIANRGWSFKDCRKACWKDAKELLTAPQSRQDALTPVQ